MSILRPNALKAKVSRGEVAFGCQLTCRSPLVAELIGHCGFDFVYIETEHFAGTDETVENAVRATELTGATAIVRIPSYDEGLVTHFLDLGTAGLIFPHVQTAEQAAEIVRMGKYPPRGERGSGHGNRASHYGLTDRAEYIRHANDETLLIAMVESPQGVQNIEGILDSGIDMIRVGLSDLSFSMGFAGEMNHPRYREALVRVIECAKARGIAVGAHSASMETVSELVALGFTFISYGSELTCLAKNLSQDLERLRTLG